MTGPLRNSMMGGSLFGTLLAFHGAVYAAGAEKADILITDGTIITMDRDRRVIDHGALAIVGNRIAAVGTTAELRAHFRARQMIDASRKVVMPGLIDGHGHAGHELLKTLGADSDRWDWIVERIFDSAFAEQNLPLCRLLTMSRITDTRR